MNNDTDLIKAIKTNNLYEVASILNGDTDPNKTASYLYKGSLYDKVTPLFIAIDKGNSDIVKLLLKSPKIKINDGIINKTTPLFLAVERNLSEIVTMLVNDVNINVNIGHMFYNKISNKNEVQTPLYIALFKSNMDALQSLLQSSSLKINGVINTNRDYALHYAIQHDNVPALKLLLNYPGVDVNIRNIYGRTPFFTACLSHPESLYILANLKGVDVNIPDNNNNTPLYDACMSKNAELVSYLITIPSIDKTSAIKDAHKFSDNIKRILLADQTDREKLLYKIRYHIINGSNKNITLKNNINQLKQPIGKILEIHSMSELPDVFPEVDSIIIYPIGLHELPTLPNNLQYLECSKNPIRSLPSLPRTLRVLLCANCELMNIEDLPDSIDYMDIRNNNIHDINRLPPNLIIVPVSNYSDSSYSSNLLLSGNPLPLGFLNGYGPITVYSNNHIHQVIHFNDATVNTMILPKGTLLFRDSKTSYKRQELFGIPMGSGHYMYPEFNVFFYPYPFVAELFIDTHVIHVFKLLRDVEVVMGVAPSFNSRYDRFDDNPSTKYLTNCSTIPTGANFVGREYDPCFLPEFSKTYPTINGMITIAAEDADSMLRHTFSQRFWSKYRTNHMSNYASSKAEGAPPIGLAEIILHPHENRYDTTSPYNYEHVMSMAHKPDSYDDAWRIVEKNLAANGPWTIDLYTKMYVDYDSASDEVKKRCVPIEDPYKLHYLNETYWKVGGKSRGKTKKQRKRSRLSKKRLQRKKV